MPLAGPKPHELAPCPLRHNMANPCRVEFVDRLADLQWLSFFCLR